MRSPFPHKTYADPYVGFRMRTFTAGTLLTLVGCGAYAIYYALSWDEPNRSPLIAMSLGSLLTTLVLPFLPIERIVASDRWREPFFVLWSVFLVGVISIGAALDGGAHAALSLAYFLPLSFASLSYPIRCMALVVVIDVLAFLAVAIPTGNASAAFIFMFAAALATTGWMAAWQARNHEWHLAERQHDEDRIAHLAYHDALTRLPNRANLERSVDAAIAAGEPRRAARHRPRRLQARERLARPRRGRRHPAPGLGAARHRGRGRRHARPPRR